MADLTLPLKVDEGAYRILDRYPTVDRMELVKLDTLQVDAADMRARRTTGPYCVLALGCARLGHAD
jgi:hypothetical protein